MIGPGAGDGQAPQDPARRRAARSVAVFGAAALPSLGVVRADETPGPLDRQARVCPRCCSAGGLQWTGHRRGAHGAPQLPSPAHPDDRSRAGSSTCGPRPRFRRAASITASNTPRRRPRGIRARTRRPCWYRRDRACGTPSGALGLSGICGATGTTRGRSTRPAAGARRRGQPRGYGTRGRPSPTSVCVPVIHGRPSSGSSSARRRSTRRPARRCPRSRRGGDHIGSATSRGRAAGGARVNTGCPGTASEPRSIPSGTRSPPGRW